MAPVPAPTSRRMSIVQSTTLTLTLSDNHHSNSKLCKWRNRTASPSPSRVPRRPRPTFSPQYSHPPRCASPRSPIPRSPIPRSPIYRSRPSSPLRSQSPPQGSHRAAAEGSPRAHPVCLWLMWPGLYQHPPHTHTCTSATSRHPREACAPAQPPVVRHGSSSYKLQRRCRHQLEANIALNGFRLREPRRPRQWLRITGLLRL